MCLQASRSRSGVGGLSGHSDVSVGEGAAHMVA